MVLAAVAFGAAGGALVATALADWRCRLVPQWSVAVLASGWAVAAVAAPDLLGGAPLAGAACGAFALVAGLALRAAGWLGGGDVKLAAALGLWLGPVDFGLALVAAGAQPLARLASAFAHGG
ncbi:MAG: fimbrial protein, partial [Gammaproteobacteria bacterium]|nr:fimbrial protein [Gammaproteobacteria bacterium]